MKHQGLTVLALCLAIGLMEGTQGHHWIAAAIWVTLGVGVAAMDWPKRRA